MLALANGFSSDDRCPPDFSSSRNAAGINCVRLIEHFNCLTHARLHQFVEGCGFNQASRPLSGVAWSTQAAVGSRADASVHRQATDQLVGRTVMQLKYDTSRARSM
jgi:hypothetical protein